MLQNSIINISPTETVFSDDEQMFLTQRIVSKDQLSIAKRESQKTGLSLEDQLLALGFITDTLLSQLRAFTESVGNFKFSEHILEPSLVQRLPRDIALKHHFIPVALENTTLKVAMVDVLDIVAIDLLRKHIPEVKTIERLATTETDLLAAVEAYHHPERSIADIFHMLDEQRNDHNAIELINTILLEAIKHRSSDIHFQPEEFFVRLKYRVDGTLKQVCAFHKDHWPSLAVRLKIMANLNIAEKRQPQSGRYSYNFWGREIDFRLSTHPTLHGENIVIRILDKQRALLPLKDLGFTVDQVAQIKSLLDSPQGIIVVTGPTGAGKTTTLYAALQELDTAKYNVMTLEQPIEYRLSTIRQTEITPRTGFTYAQGIRSLLRQDPDIIFVGEIRDEDTAKMALRAAMTGHLVLTTLHTQDALGVITRFSDLGIPPIRLAGQLKGVIAQRLLRKLCPACKKVLPTKDKAVQPFLFTAKGCSSCDESGYKGRMGCFEILHISKQLEVLLAQNSSHESLHECAKKQGHKSLLEDGKRIKYTGQTDEAELKRVLGQDT
jgi:type II secretory ATPase GspE/PulE/Tfp pilus assembly ATPase PilB-like protein